MKMKLLVLATLVALGGTMAACGSPAPREPVPDDTSARVSVETAGILEADIASSFEAGGVVRARATAVIASRMLAPVVEVRVRPGDRVRQGATLITLDPREVGARADGASASLRASEEAARAADANVEAAVAAEHLASASHGRVSGLRAKESATAQELDQAVAGLAAAGAQVAGARAQAAAAAAARDAARAAVETARVMASYAVLTAPFNGVITSRTVDPGSMASPGAPLLTVEDTSALHLEATMDEARAELVRVGATAEVRLDGGGAADGTWLASTVTEVGRVDPDSHSFLVKLALPAGTVSRTGAFGRVRFAGPSRPGLTAPASSVVRRGQLTFLFAVDAEGRARLRAVTVAPAPSQGRIEVLSGAAAGDRVVVAPPVGFADGTRVSDPVSGDGASPRAGARQ